jgi:membrane protein implicated in regulation of membrane protease activity
MLDPVSIAIITGAVLVVLLVVIAVIATVVLAPAVRRSLAEREATPDDDRSAQRLENDDRRSS